jgi:hypothetical protein
MADLPEIFDTPIRGPGFMGDAVMTKPSEKETYRRKSKASKAQAAKVNASTVKRKNRKTS